MYRTIEVDTVKKMIRERDAEEAQARREAAVLARIKKEEDESVKLSTLDEAKGVALGLVVVAELTLLAAIL